jgi:hypothetical protein
VLAQVIGPQEVVAPEGADPVVTQWMGPQIAVAPVLPLAPVGGFDTHGSGRHTSVAPAGEAATPLEAPHGTGTHTSVAPRGSAIAPVWGRTQWTGAHTPMHNGEHVVVACAITE